MKTEMPGSRRSESGARGSRWQFNRLNRTARVADLRVDRGAPANHRRLDWPELGLIALSAVVVALLWYTPLMFPLRFFSVLVHECSHAIAGLLTGGSVDSINLNENTGGLTYIHGGNQVIFGSAGYLGTVFWGCLLLYLSRFKEHAGRICLGVGLVLMVMTLSFVSLLHNPFGFFYGSTAGLCIALVGWKFNKAAPYFMKFLGVAVCLFSFMDIHETLFSGADRLQHSDAGILASSTGVPAVVWAVAWLIFATVTFLFFGYLSATTRGPRRSKTALDAPPLSRSKTALDARPLSLPGTSIPGVSPSTVKKPLFSTRKRPGSTSAKP